MAKQINFSMTATFCIFYTWQNKPNVLMAAIFCIFTQNKNQKQILNDFKHKIHVQTNTIQTIKCKESIPSC